MTDTVAETVTLTATDTTDGSLSPPPTVVFIRRDRVCGTTSTLTAAKRPRRRTARRRP